MFNGITPRMGYFSRKCIFMSIIGMVSAGYRSALTLLWIFERQWHGPMWYRYVLVSIAMYMVRYELGCLRLCILGSEG